MSHRVIRLAVLASVTICSSLISSRSFAQPDESADSRRQLSELFDIFLENAKSYRNYQVRVERNSVLKAENHPIVKDCNKYMIWMDWEAQRCIVIHDRKKTDEENNKLIRRDFVVEKFSEGVRSTRGFRLPHLPRVENVDFNSFLYRAEVPRIEFIAFTGYPSSSIPFPFEDYVNAAKVNAKGYLRRLPDGTLVRVVGNAQQTQMITHFSPEHNLPTYRGTTPVASNSGSQESEPTSFSKNTYEKHNEVYRLKEVLFKEAQSLDSYSIKPLEKPSNRFLDGSGTMQFLWKQFNESSLVFPTDEKLSNDINEWETLLE
ncbi:MAG: hypothetical protein ACK56W_05660 [Pirellula sp.]|nr:hypothetical protein [Pirellula sp.]